MATPDGYGLSFADEFNDSNWQGTSYWNTSFAQWGGLRTLTANKELELYVDKYFKGNTTAPLGLNPFSVKDGVLSIEAKPTSSTYLSSLWGMPYTSGVLTSKHTQTYGYFEVSAKLPEGKGLWPAFWLIGDGNYGNNEIDVFEVLGHETNRVYQSTHKYGTSYQDVHKDYFGIDSARGFHTYGLEWTPTEITWYIDGVETLRTKNFVDVPMYAILNLAVGGSWGGNPDASTSFPANLQIDYYRAFASLQATKVVLTAGDTATTLVGGVVGDSLTGGAGNDMLVGSAGPDTLDGGSGFDTASYAGSPGGVTVSLASNSGLGAHAQGDVLKSIEGIVGSEFADTLSGNAGANQIEGAGGNDVLAGGGGSDVFVFRPEDGSDSIVDFGSDDTIRLSDFSGLTYAGLASLVHQEGTSAVLDVSGVHVVVANISASALLDRIEIEGVAKETSTASFRVEAEDFAGKQGTVWKSVAAASEQKMLAAGAGDTRSNAYFDGDDGVYNVTVGYFDQSGGRSKLELYAASRNLDTFVWDKDLGTRVGAATKATHTITGVELHKGDLLELCGHVDGSETMGVDYLDFTFMKALAADSHIHVETEAMTRSGGMTWEALGCASGGKVLAVRSGTSGSASLEFSGKSGNYDLSYGFFDESDGKGRLALVVDGKEIDSFVLNKDLGSSIADTRTRSVHGVDNVHLDHGSTVELRAYSDGGEAVLTDYIDFFYQG